VQTLPSSAQVVPLALNPSLGQLATVPLQASATSQSLIAGRQTAPELPAGCVHVPASHTSRLHALESGVQAVPLALKASGGHAVAVPLHCSLKSHSPTAGRHSVPELPAGWVHAPD
jgi:hypothetical protein